MKKWRRTIGILLIFIFLFTLNFSISAQSIFYPNESVLIEDKQIENMTKDEFINFILSQKSCSITNEFAVIFECQRLSDSELYNMGYSLNDIEKLKNVDVISEVNRRRALTDNELSALGMSNEQILSLRAYNGSIESLMSISATLYASASVNSGVTYNSSTNKSTAKLSYYWSWSDTPWFSHTDMMAIGNTENFYVNTTTSSSKVLYAYSGSNAPYSSYWKTKSVTAFDSGLGAQVKFPVIDKVDYDSLGNPLPFYCTYGYMHAMVYRNGHYSNNIGMTGSYGHNQLILSPSASLSLSGASVSINFSFGVVKLGEAIAYTN